MACTLVHYVGWPGAALAQKDARSKQKQQAAKPSGPEVHYGTEGLPQPVLEMRDAILSAVRSGRIEELRHAYELNELKPDIAQEPVGDPVAYWRSTSADGQGFEILAALGQLLDAGYAVLPIGRDIENNKVYVWPYFAEMPLGGITPAQDVELMRLMGPALAREMRAKGRYAWWRLTIGADGVWHTFRKIP